MKTFLREYWLWILVPFMVVAVGLGLALWMMSRDAGGSSPFIYTLF